MSKFEGTAAYLNLAERLNAGELAETELPAAVIVLPPLTRQILDDLARKAEEASVNQPRLGWAIAAIADAHAAFLREHRAAHAGYPFLQALAAWCLARAANAWVRPDRVEGAVQRARAGFAAIEEAGWVAASDWQLYAQPWTRNDYKQAASVLSEALASLERAGLDQFVPHCRLSLAYAQILIGQYSEAEANIGASEHEFDERIKSFKGSSKDFTSQGDRLNLARCWLHRSSALRRQGAYVQSLAYLNRALEVFETFNAPIEAAKTHFQLGYSQWRTGIRFEVVEQRFAQAARTFAERDLPLWEAQCYGGLAQVYSDTGRLSEARQALSKASDIYTQYKVLGLRADNLLDSGRLEMFWGNPASSLDYLAEAERLYTSIGSWRMIPIAAMYRGRASSQFGDYIHALHHLERSEALLQKIDEPDRMAECGMHLARVWVWLGRPQNAHPYLSRAAGHYRGTNQLDFLASVHHRQAEAYFQEGKQADAIAVLEEALAISQVLGERSQVALSRRLLGEARLSLGNSDEAFLHLQAAAGDFAAMGMIIDQAACQIALGEYYAQKLDPDAARQSWEYALGLSKGVMPDVAWRAQAGLADLAEKAGEVDRAIEAYRRMIAALTLMRRDLWQPSLVGTYLRIPAQALDRAVALAAGVDSVQDALDFIEESKGVTHSGAWSQTIAALFTASGSYRRNDSASELDGTVAEIRWLQERLRGVTSITSRLVTTDQAELIGRIKGKIQQYDEMISRLERQSPGRSGGARSRTEQGITARQSFDRDRFRRMAGSILGNSWAALHYYLSGDSLVTVMLTPDDLRVWSKEFSTRARMALGHCTGVPAGGGRLLSDELKILGEFLLPQELLDHLNRRAPDTTLLIVPHRQLHQVPWAALRTGSGARFLVESCVPVILPSLQDLALLWSRSIETQPDPRDGLLLAISDFQGRRPPLPQVIVEADMLSAHLGPLGKLLSERTATMEELLALAQEGGLSRFAFWHIASHAFHDRLTGRLSGIALFDRDLWLDQLWELAPLPQLVTLSACNGAQSLVHEGDEHVGLAINCLAAGARHVVGSLWPVLDDTTAHLLIGFYTHLWSAKDPSLPNSQTTLRLPAGGPSLALALAQRRAISQSMDAGHWGGFVCIGSPV